MARLREEIVDWFAVLGVPRDADPATIKKAYRARARASHPDVGGDAAAFARVSQAYEVLSDRSARARLLRDLRQREDWAASAAAARAAGWGDPAAARPHPAGSAATASPAGASAAGEQAAFARQWWDAHPDVTVGGRRPATGTAAGAASGTAPSGVAGRWAAVDPRVRFGAAGAGVVGLVAVVSAFVASSPASAAVVDRLGWFVTFATY